MPEQAVSAASIPSTRKVLIRVLRKAAATRLHPGYDPPPTPDSGGDIPHQDYRAGRRTGGRATGGLDRDSELRACGEAPHERGRQREARIEAAQHGDRDRRRLALKQPELVALCRARYHRPRGAQLEGAAVAREECRDLRGFGLA